MFDTFNLYLNYYQQSYYLGSKDQRQLDGSVNCAYHEKKNERKLENYTIYIYIIPFESYEPSSTIWNFNQTVTIFWLNYG